MSQLSISHHLPSSSNVTVMAPIREEDMQIVHAKPLAQLHGQRIEPKLPSQPSSSDDVISVDSNGAYDINDNAMKDKARVYIDKQINKKVSHATDKLALNMDIALEGAIGDTGEIQTRLHSVEGKVDFLTKVVGIFAITGIVAGVWSLWDALKPKTKKKLEINQQPGLNTKFIQ
jgi:hypothetical protein